MNNSSINTAKYVPTPNIPNHITNTQINNDAPPLTPKTRRSMGFVQPKCNVDNSELANIPNVSSSRFQEKAQENSTRPDKDIKQVLMSAPCPCSRPTNFENLVTNTNIQTNKFIGPYADYDVPSVPIPIQQVSAH